MNAIRVIIDGQNDLILDYAIPSHLSHVQPGCRVTVPLRNRQTQATVISLVEPDPAIASKLKPFHSLLDEQPMVSESLLKLAVWAADYYATGLDQMIRCLIPETVRQENTTEKTHKILSLTETVTQEDLEKLYRKAPRQAQIIDYLQHQGLARAALSELGAGALSPAKALAQKGIIRITEESVHRDPNASEEYAQSEKKILNPGQTQALDDILAMSKAEIKKPILLQGVTGSGKTEVYLQTVEEIVKQGKSAIIAVPEISLTPQTLHRFKSRFAHLPGAVAVLHSLLSSGERYDEWHAIREGKAQIVIGPRSAIFAPVQNLGIIIIDEEHDASYKQESSPRYHGRDLAVLRGHFEQAVVVLGSATPSLETLHNVNIGKYAVTYLNERADGQEMPLIRILDLKNEGKNKSGPQILTERLRIAIDQRLAKGEQVILLLNRRGFARSLQCPDCGHVMSCLHCTLPLTYHKTDDRLLCHLCGYKSITPRTCPECKSSNILLQGYGTQKVEEFLKNTFKHARITRIDADIAKRKNAVRDILNQFRSKKIDILLGTQMIAKGLDFPNVTLVGVLNADLGLHIPDLRASERTFQLLTQVAGRAGRGNIDGEVIIQTFTPQSPALQFARRHDCHGFSTQEMEIRQAFHLPPYSHIALLTVRSQHENKAEFAMNILATRLKKAAEGTQIEVAEPMPAAIPKAHGQFRFQLMLKAPMARPLSRLLKQTIQEAQLGDDVTSVIDIDAMTFM